MFEAGAVVLDQWSERGLGVVRRCPWESRFGDVLWPGTYIKRKAAISKTIPSESGDWMSWTTKHTGFFHIVEV